MTKEEIEQIILSKLVVTNKQSLHHASAAIMELVDKEDESFLVWCFIHASWDRRDGLTWKGDGNVITLLELKELYHEQSKTAKNE